MLLERLYSNRTGLAILPSLIIIALALFWGTRMTPIKPTPKPAPPMKLSMVSLPAPQPVAPPPPKPATPERPQPAKPVVQKSVPIARPAPAPLSVPAKSIPIEASTPNTVAAPIPTVPPVAIAETTPPKPRPAPESTPAPAPPAPAPASANLEAGYIAKLRAYLESSKRYPTGREASQMRPAGMVRIWLELDRSGHLINSGIEQSAHSMLLDHAALSTVRQGEFPGFPADAWSGSTSHRFTVDLNYTPAN